MRRIVQILCAFAVAFAPAVAIAVDGWVRDERERVVEYGYARDRIQWMDADLLGRYLAQVIGDYAKGKSVFLQFTERTPSVLRYLMGSRSIRYRAGFELELDDWVKTQPNNSIDPVSFFREALHLAHGDVYQALLGAHELLKNHARFFNHVIVTWPSSYEMRREFFDHFIDLRGDLKERGGHFRGDHAGGWYRMFGMALYAYHRALQYMPAREKSWPLDPGPLRRWYWMPRVRLAMAAVIAEVTKGVVGWPDPDRMKIVSNLRGVRIAHSMLRSLSNPRRLENLPDASKRAWLSDGGPNYGVCLRLIRWASETR